MRSGKSRNRGGHPLHGYSNKYGVFGIALLLIFFSLWCVAVAKVVLIEREHYSSDPSMKDINIQASNHKTENSQSQSFLNYRRHETQRVADIQDKSYDFSKLHSSEWIHSKKNSNRKDSIEDSKKKLNVVLAQPPQLQAISEDNNHKSFRGLVKQNDAGMQLGPDNVLPSYELKWPPVQLDGTIAANEGYDVMKLTELKVPRFWSPKPGEDVNKIGSKVNNMETIFLMIASYRDWQCHETITSAYSLADHPERLFVGAVEQNAKGDMSCVYTEEPCDQNPDQPICKYRNQISIYPMEASMATGPVTARHIGDRMYRGEYFVMQMDAHCLFIRHWDTRIIDQWTQTHNEMAVLSSYLTDVKVTSSTETNARKKLNFTLNYLYSHVDETLAGIHNSRG